MSGVSHTNPAHLGAHGGLHVYQSWSSCRFNPDNYDVIVVGAGYAGAVVARRMAENCNSKVAIFERRNHIAGNAYDKP